MSNNLLFRCLWHTVAGKQSEEGTFIGSQSGAGMALYNAGNILAKAPFAYEISTALGMADIMSPAPADIVEHRTPFNKVKIDTGMMCCIFACTVPYCLAVGNHFCAAPGFMQQVFAVRVLFFRHGQATS
jgi:hypothetical protein